MFGTESSLSMFLNTLTPKFYVALTGTSSLISGLILIFEWWYFRKYGTSFIEQVSVSHLRPLLGGVDSSSPSNASTSNGEADSSRQSVSECKVWRNPLNLFRGAEYNRYTWVTGREPLTYYDMNLSAQDHQTFFTCDSDHLRPADAIMQKAWRERNPQARISAAHEALELEDCATAYILLAEEEATTIMEAERLFKQALKAGESCYRRSQQLQHHSTQYEAQHRRDTNVLVYIKRRLAMCSRKLGRTREAVKMMRDHVQHPRKPAGVAIRAPELRRRPGRSGQIRRYQFTQICNNMLHSSVAQSQGGIRQILSRGSVTTRAEYSRDERSRSHPQSGGIQPSRSQVSAGDEESDSSSRTHPEARRQRGHRLRLLPPAALEAGRGGAQPAPLHLGGQCTLLLCSVQNDPLSSREGSPVLPVPHLHRDGRQRAATHVSRGVGVPEEGAALLHPLHSRPVFLHRHAGSAHTPVS
ncbi:suppressor of tumorigenicity 7 protein isoform X11 [Takifugu rubripes]|uniref:suppressor of tumorigenicity 7 protein isoform X11 n=1 Tax=Takifugu rubripes TaxID=31033 RepID=UPI0011453065|nr:suppressor of tumorigenicity 7 protein isoform X11 [Takifugu rubripes]